MTEARNRKLATMEAADVRTAYRRWVPVYDRTFGKFAEAALRSATARANELSGQLLDVGVGTGLALPHYGPELRVTGIDLSTHMLEKACERVRRSGQSNIVELLEMDATALAFPDSSFDVAVAMFVMTVVPDPAAAIREMARVTRPGGTVLICNHFSVGDGVRGTFERGLAKYASRIGFRAEFPVETVLGCPSLRLISQSPVKPFDFFTLLEFQRLM